MLAFWVVNIILWVTFGFYNYCHIHHRYDFHPSGAFFSVVLAIAFVFCPMMYDVHTWQEMLKVFMTTLILRWIVFDISYNLFCGKQWWYYGNMRRGEQGYVPYYKNGAIDRGLGWSQIPIKALLLLGLIIYSI